MENWLKVLIMLTVVAIWASAMSYWIFVQHVQPDPLMWAIPGGVYLTLWPQLPSRGKRSKTERSR